jgi:membrane protease YdiL (CAAX protease family)
LKKVSLALSLVFIVIFLVLNAAGTMISAKTGVLYSGQIPLLLIFSVFLLAFTKKRALWDMLGLVKVSAEDAKASLYYIPLGVMILSNGVFLFDATTPARDLFMVIAFMVCIAFHEEFLFRGLLLRAIEESGGTRKAVIIAGLTFGFGHIVNLLNGYTGVKQMMQIVLACLIGLVLSMLFVRTKSIVPGIVFHFFFNIASALSKDGTPAQNYIMMAVILGVAAVYLAYLMRKGIPVTNEPQNG